MNHPMTPQQQMEHVRASLIELATITQRVSTDGLVESADYYADVLKRMADTCTQVKRETAVRR